MSKTSKEKTKFYYGNKIDSQGRIALGKMFDAEKYHKAVVYVDESDMDKIYVVPYLGLEEIPEYALKTVDMKGRVNLPKALRRNATGALIGKGAGTELTLWLQFDMPNK
jgi:DNA-binding transcriptional regulator/RsmH inhibitor MraZ